MHRWSTGLVLPLGALVVAAAAAGAPSTESRQQAANASDRRAARKEGSIGGNGHNSSGQGSIGGHGHNSSGQGSIGVKNSPDHRRHLENSVLDYALAALEKQLVSMEQAQTEAQTEECTMYEDWNAVDGYRGAAGSWSTTETAEACATKCQGAALCAIWTWYGEHQAAWAHKCITWSKTDAKAAGREDPDFWIEQSGVTSGTCSAEDMEQAHSKEAHKDIEDMEQPYSKQAHKDNEDMEDAREYESGLLPEEDREQPYSKEARKNNEADAESAEDDFFASHATLDGLPMMTALGGTTTVAVTAMSTETSTMTIATNIVTNTITATTATSTTTAATTLDSTTTTSHGMQYLGQRISGGKNTTNAFYGWLSVWRGMYKSGVWHAGLEDPWESLMPAALKGVKTKVVTSSGGVAGGVVSEGMGYGLMIEGLLAHNGDTAALQNGLALTKSWLAMVNGPSGLVQPFAGGINLTGSATQTVVWPYGISAVEWSHEKLGPAGLPAWKFPINKSNLDGYAGSATDGDQDAVLGMIYLASALGYPADFVDMVVRTVIAFASADLGFPDLYRTLPDGTVMYVPKLGSHWGGLTPPGGKFGTVQEPWCYSPGYSAPAHYRTFRDFIQTQWRKEFTEYLPSRLNGSFTTKEQLVHALDSAVTAGYNILYYASCPSGTVSNWVGVKAPCESDGQLSCSGVPWAHTPYVGEDFGTCQQSGTDFGSFGADASRTAWRVAMDYLLYPEESMNVRMFNRDGMENPSIDFNSRTFLNRIVRQYATKSICDGGLPGDCMRFATSPYEFAYAYDLKSNATGTMCPGVPNPPESWWAGFMAYPTFAAFVAPTDDLSLVEMSQWMDTFAGICNFSKVNFGNFAKGGKPIGDICLTSYFEASQAVIATLVMSGLPTPLQKTAAQDSHGNGVMVMAEVQGLSRFKELGTVAAAALLALVAASALGFLWAFARPQRPHHDGVLEVMMMETREDTTE